MTFFILCLIGWFVYLKLKGKRGDMLALAIIVLVIMKCAGSGLDQTEKIMKQVNKAIETVQAQEVKKAEPRNEIDEELEIFFQPQHMPCKICSFNKCFIKTNDYFFCTNCNTKLRPVTEWGLVD